MTRPGIINEDGSKTKPGLLGDSQSFQSFGSDILNCAKRVHGCCFSALEVYLKNKDTLDQRTKLFKEAIQNCDSILRLVDLCLYRYGQNNKKKRRSFEYVARLTYTTKKSIQDRLNRDKLIYEQKYKPKEK